MALPKQPKIINELVKIKFTYNRKIEDIFTKYRKIIRSESFISQRIDTLELTRNFFNLLYDLINPP